MPVLLYFIMYWYEASILLILHQCVYTTVPVLPADYVTTGNGQKMASTTTAYNL